MTAYPYRLPARYRRRIRYRRRATGRDKAIGLAVGALLIAGAAKTATAAHDGTASQGRAVPVTGGSEGAFFGAVLADLSAPDTRADLGSL